MAVPYSFQTRTGNIPLSELDADFTYFTTSIAVSGLNTTIGGSLTTGTSIYAGTTLTVAGTATFNGSSIFNGAVSFVAGVSIPSVSISGNATFTGTGNRIYGDFSNATIANRVAFQTSTTNGNTNLSLIPNGTSVISGLNIYNNSDPTNSAYAGIASTGSQIQLAAAIRGTGTYLPLTFYTNAVEQMRIDTSGYVGIGAASNGAKMVISQNSTIPAYNNGGAVAAVQIALTDSSGTTSRLVLDAANGGGCSVTGRASGGTYASPTATVANQLIINFTSRGYTGTTWIGNGALNLLAESTFTTSSTPTAWQFLCGNTGATGQTERMRLWSSGGLSLGNVVDPGTANLSVTGLGTFGTLTSTGVFTASSTSTFTGLATFNGGATFVGNVSQTSGTYSFSNATGTYTIGATSGTSTITVGQSTVSQTTNIQAGATASGSTKTINLGTAGLAGSTTNIAVGATAGTSTTTLNGNVVYTPANVTDTLTLGSASQTGTLTLGQSTVSQTTNIGAGVTASGSTKAINIGTLGAAGSTTNIALGGTAGTSSTTLNGTLTTAGAAVINNTAASNTTIGSAATTGTIALGAATQSGTITLGQSTTGQTTNIQAGAMASGQTKTINIGTAGLSGSTTTIAIGSAVSGATSTVTVNGVLKNQVYTVATLAGVLAPATVGVGARAFVSDATVTTFASVVVGGGSNPVPVYSDGTSWRIG